MTAPRDQTGDPLHGVTLERMLNKLVEHLGWEAMGKRIAIRCFTSDPTVSSSLKFLRKTPWAREKVRCKPSEPRNRPASANRSNL
jgi:uncharacterized protein (DUF2132 family)